MSRLSVIKILVMLSLVSVLVSCTELTVDKNKNDYILTPSVD